jgi:hypothetical protein
MSSGSDFLASRKKKDVGAPSMETGLRASSMPYNAQGEPKHYTVSQRKEDKVKTARQPASAHLLIDSLDRYPNGSPTTNYFGLSSSDWTLQLPQYVLNGFFTRLAVTQIQFQWNLPTIITGYNDQFIITQNAIPSIGTIPQGWYSPTTLASAITAALAAASTPPAAAVTAAYNPLSETFVLTSATAIRIPPTTIDGGGTTNARASRFGLTSGLQYTGIPASGGATTLSGGVPTMLATRFIDLRSIYLAKNQRVKDVTTLPQNIVSDIIARIYATAPNTTTTASASSPFQMPWIMNISYPVPKYIRWNAEEPVSNFSLQLLDDNGQPLPWSVTAGCEYALTMIASED